MLSIKTISDQHSYQALPVGVRPVPCFSGPFAILNPRLGLPPLEPLLKLRLVLPYSSSSTPTVPYSTADILYGNEVSSRNQGEDGRQNTFIDGDRSKPKSKELDYPGNIRRPNSKTGSRKSLSIDTGE